ncbi:MAG: N-acetyltransferase [Hyphomicrobiaceae bacterium]|nr:N-acetyltransferase [Hyphomicrobiaceae bacterium]
MPAGVTLRGEVASDAAAILDLHEESFGPGRYARTAFRLRETAASLGAFNRVAILDGVLVGSVQFWRLEADGVPGVLLGPLAVDPRWKSAGIGRSLMASSLRQIAEEGDGPVLLVGDAPYYAPLGFQVVAPGRLVLPGPVDPARLLIALDRPAFCGRVNGI